MRSIWIFGITLNLFAYLNAGPIEVVYGGDGCDCPSRLNYKVAVPNLPAPPRYIPENYGYKLDVPQIQGKARVSYTFDFSVEEPKPPCQAPPPEKLNLLAKVDRIALNKPDCPHTYVPSPPSQPAPCNCGQCGITKPLYRYVNGKIIQPCRCRRPKCNCNLRCPNSINIENPVLVTSNSMERNNKNIRRKRDLERIFFRPRRQEQLRSPRFVKLYHKPISIQMEKEKEKENWFNLDLFSDANPFKRKTKKVFFPDLRSRIVKRDIKGEYDLLEKERQETDLTIPEIIQFMPETLHPDFKRGPCQFGCRKKFSQISSTTKNYEELDRNQAQIYEFSNGVDMESTTPTPTTSVITSTNVSEKDEQINEMPRMANSFTKRNVNDFHYQAAVPSKPYSYSTSQQNDYAAQNPTRNPTNPQDTSARLLCEQRNIYATMRSEADPSYGYNRMEDNYGTEKENEHLRLLVSTSSTVPDPFRSDPTPLQYTGDLEIPVIHYNEQRTQDPLLGAPKYPVQHISRELLDRIISDIVYRHPDFIEASTHYGGALVDPEPEQAEQTKDFIKKLIDGRLSLFFDAPENEYIHYYPVPSYRSHVYNPYITSAYY